jgi:hypothetical protein
LQSQFNLKSDKYFTDSVRISNAILAAPNGVASYATNVITAYADLTILIPDGRNSDNSLKSKTVTLEENSTLELGAVSGNYFLLIDEEGHLSYKDREHLGYYYIAPNSSVDWVYYDDALNLWRSTADGLDYRTFSGIIIGEFVCSSGVISKLKTNSTMSLIKNSDMKQYAKLRSPDYNSGISYSVSDLTTIRRAPCDGVLVVSLVPVDYNWMYLYIGGYYAGMATRTNSYLSRLTGQYLLAENELFSVNMNADPQHSIMIFYPMKGAL